MEDRIKKVWEEIKDKPIEYTLQKIAELEDKLEEKEPDMLIMASRQNGKTNITKIKLKEMQNKVAIKELEELKKTFIWGKENGCLTPDSAIHIIGQYIDRLKEYVWI